MSTALTSAIDKQEPVPEAESSTAGRLHGTRAKYTLDGCRCYACGLAASAYRMSVERAKAYGTWQPFADAGPVREHVLALQAAGIGRRRVSELSGVPKSTVLQLLYGKRGREAARIRTDTAQKLFAVQPDRAVPADGALVDATGLRRRVQALVAVGYPLAFLARRFGMTDSNFGRVVRSQRVLASTDRRAREVYDELWNADPAKLGIAAQSRNRARNHAANRQWPGPLAWDDDTVGDPGSRPRGVRETA